MLLASSHPLPTAVVPVDQGSSTGMGVESAVAAENSARPKPIAQAMQLSAPAPCWCPFHYTLRFLSWGSLRFSWGRRSCNSAMSLEEFNGWDGTS